MASDITERLEKKLAWLENLDIGMHDPMVSPYLYSCDVRECLRQIATERAAREQAERELAAVREEMAIYQRALEGIVLDLGQHIYLGDGKSPNEDLDRAWCRAATVLGHCG